ncbi:hypothetical protein [Motilibacter deserti]|uniref:Sporulation related protein n=1 Tax=Motilibacter deserti TaxID=2714956 RepID=A0ABX0GTC3_9ACTN|nr:hypothetical protein [Motilibacter deserti]NHC12899.1 hypothetical protein [Motilibacter deserti]
MAIVAALLVGAVLVVGGVLTLGGGDDEPASTAEPVGGAAAGAPGGEEELYPDTAPMDDGFVDVPDPAPSLAEPTEAVPPEPEPEPETTAPDAGSALPTSMFYTVVMSSNTAADGGHEAALEDARNIEAAGYEALVFRSDDYSNLRPGYWVAAAGVHSTLAEARAEANALRDVVPGIEVPYPRCVGTEEECPDDDLSS